MLGRRMCPPRSERSGPRSDGSGLVAAGFPISCASLQADRKRSWSCFLGIRLRSVNAVEGKEL